MKKQNKNYSEAKELRQKAEAEWTTRKLTYTMFDVDNSKFMHELQVHQIELEMQNEELKIARDRAEIALEKYVNIYDFAPSGYLTLSNEGDIINLNFAAAKLLGNNRINLKNTRFGLFIHPNSKEIYNQVFDQVFNINSKINCELYLISTSDTSIYVHIDATVSESFDQCLLTMIDISERKRLEVELEKVLKQNKELNCFFLERELRMVELKIEINDLLTKSGCEKEYLIF